LPSATILPSLLARWRADPDIGGNVVAWNTLPARPARFEPFPFTPDPTSVREEEIHPALVEALRGQGIQALYTHQKQAWLHAKEGKHVVVVTSTASGKTLCYNLPVLDALLRDPSARALYLFPTKALAQDQYAAISRLLSGVQSYQSTISDLPSAIYDGDTPSNQRPTIRANARIILSNPDMLHTGILPHHTRWDDFFRHLRFVVIDELHSYRGVFGSHVANVLRRLRRVARHYGANPQFILASATIANPAELAEWLVEAPVQVVDDDGSARGPRHFLIYNPPVIDPDLGLRRSAASEAMRLADDLLAADVQTILFGQSRRGVEMLLRGLRDRSGLRDRQSEISSQPSEIRGYRSGYLPNRRREIEHGLRDGSVRAVVATNALELGIDIGGMGAALLVGYPGTIASARQQMGRAGRGAAASLAVLIASANPLDQYLAKHPEFFFGRTPEQALVNPDHLLILLGHLRCAAFELPFQEGEGFGRLPAEALHEFLEFLHQSGELHQSGTKYFWMSEKYPAQGVSLRSAGAENIVLDLTPGPSPERSGETVRETIGQVDRESALWMVHPGAVYLHESQTYLVENLDLENGRAHLLPFDGDYFTEPKRDTTLTLLNQQASAPVPGGYKAHGEIEVTTQVSGFRRVRWLSRENLGYEPLDLPPTTLQTTGYWLTLDEATVEALQAEGLWSNAPNDYGPGWPTLARQIRARDNFTCQMCSAPEQGRAHDVHHKIPFRAFFPSPLAPLPKGEGNYSPPPVGEGQGVRAANDPSNLITLCQACHRRAETAVRIRSGLAGLGYVLWQLAPLFLMCDIGDLSMHTDPQSPLAEGQPAVAIYELVPAGIGFSARLFELHFDLIQRAHEVVSSCDCTDGCPACVGPGGENGYGGKKETLALLEKANA
jgi:DEAD/DEAH box helicase domain-containing protein